MVYRVEVTAEADANGDEAYLWIARRSQTAAGKWYRGLLDAIASLDRNPERCPIAPESSYFGTEVRELLYGKRYGVYRILFEIRSNVVVVLHIRHAARDYLSEQN